MQCIRILSNTAAHKMAILKAEAFVPVGHLLQSSDEDVVSLAIQLINDFASLEK